MVKKKYRRYGEDGMVKVYGKREGGMVGGVCAYDGEGMVRGVIGGFVW